MKILDFFRLRRLCRNRDGSMLVEFALVVPGFFIILMASLAVSDALAAYNRMQNVSNTVGVLIARLKVVSNEDMVGITTAASSHLFPFPVDSLSILIASVWIDDTGTPSILWCERWGKVKPSGGACAGQEIVGGSDMGYWVTGTDLTVADLNIPANLQNPNTGLVVAVTSYEWDAPYAPLSAAQLTNLTMHDEFFSPPRADITLTPPTRDRDTPKPNSSYKIRG